MTILENRQLMKSLRALPGSDIRPDIMKQLSGMDAKSVIEQALRRALYNHDACQLSRAVKERILKKP